MPVTRKNSPWLAQRLRERIQSGHWTRGQMIPGRRGLATEYAAALTTVERAVATLMAEGLLRVDDRRGTYVADAAVVSAPASVQATVGLVASLAHYDTEAMRSEQWPARVLAACEHALAAHSGIHQVCLNLLPAVGRAMHPTEASERLLSNGVAAAILIGDEDADSRQLRARLRGAGVQVVSATFDANPGMGVDVGIDDFAGGTLAVQHLRARGYARMLYLRPFTVPWVETRLVGAQSACAPDALTVFPATTAMDGNVDGPRQVMAGLAVAHNLLNAGLEPGTGVIAPNDAVAAAFIRVAADQGLIAGRDYGIVGFDDRERDAGLTSLRPPLEQIGTESAGMLLRLLRGESRPARIRLPYRLIPRDSTRSYGAQTTSANPCTVSEGSIA